MARILDENFKEHGYSENWTETINAGCTLDENFAVASFTAGTTAPKTFYSHCASLRSDGDATGIVEIAYDFSAEIDTTYARVNFIVVSAVVADSATMGIAFMNYSVAGTLLWNFKVRYTVATGWHTILIVRLSNTTTTQIPFYGILFNTLYSLEMYYSNTNCAAICRLNSTIISTIALTSAFTYNATGLRVGMPQQNSSIATVYFDNIRVNSDTGTANNSWPGTSYDEPIREIDYLSTQRFVGMSL